MTIARLNPTIEHLPPEIRKAKSSIRHGSCASGAIWHNRARSSSHPRIQARYVLPHPAQYMTMKVDVTRELYAGATVDANIVGDNA